MPLVKPPGEGYKTSPSFEILARMSEGELQGVKNFTIWNEFGQICWENFVDLTNVDLWKTIQIEQDGVTVYDEDIFTKGVDYPPVGQKLNNPATIKMFSLHIDLPTRQEKIKFLEDLAKNMDVSSNQHCITHD